MWNFIQRYALQKFRGDDSFRGDVGIDVGYHERDVGDFFVIGGVQQQLTLKEDEQTKIEQM